MVESQYKSNKTNKQNTQVQCGQTNDNNSFEASRERHFRILKAFSSLLYIASTISPHMLGLHIISQETSLWPHI